MIKRGLHRLAPYFFCWMAWCASVASAAPISQPDQTSTNNVSSHPPEVAIGVLLPLDSAELGSAAKVVLAGIEAAQQTDKQTTPPILYIQSYRNADDVANQYADLQARHPKLILGPLTREDIDRVAPIAKLPTLALNSFTPNTPPNSNLFSFSLNTDQEVTEIIQVMKGEGKKRPVLISASDALSQKIAQGFLKQWIVAPNQANIIELRLTELATPADQTLLSQADAAFLALNAEQAVSAQQNLPATLAQYGVSTINREDKKVTGVRFVDMPWLLMPQHSAVLLYPKPQIRLNYASNRLYALGIDAYRLGTLLLNRKSKPAIKLEGVTGDIRLQSQQFIRQLPSWILPIL